MSKFFKSHLNDLIVIFVLLIIALVLIFTKGCNNNDGNLVATIYKKNEVLEVIDLSKEKDESRLLAYKGEYGDVVVEVKKNAIRMKSSSCPHQDCVNTGWVTTPNKPIICLYNAICIEIKGNSTSADIII